MMHRRGGGKFRGGNRNFQTSGGDRFQDDHDNRAKDNFKTSRRVSFKTQNRHSNKNLSDMKVKAFLDDEDMGGDLQVAGGSHSSGDYKRRGKFRSVRKGSPIPRGIGGGGKLLQHPAGWYMVTINHGCKYEREILLNLLRNALSPTVFNPNYYRVDKDNNSAQFYVDDYDVAEKILRQDKRIELPDGFKMLIKVRGSLPHIKVDETLKQKMKLAMVKRFNAQTKALDLTKFHADPDLSDVFCALFRQPIMAAVVDIIAENIPDLEALNLNDNKLNMIDHLKVLSSKLPQLRIIYLAHNRLVTLSSLDAFRNLPIAELHLDGNPCKKRFKDNSHYVSEVKKKFPKLVKLDGVELGPTIGFETSDETKQMPQWKQIFFCDNSGQELVAKFLEQYFAIYDSDNRQQLLEAYHESALLSVTATNNQHFTEDERLYPYYKFGRNLIHPKGYDHRFASLKRGRLVVVALLNDLPPTKHDPQSFAVDLTFFSPQMIVLTITGLFKERNSDPKAEYVRSFQKTLVIVPNNGGFCIRNELLHINNANRLQAKKIFTGQVAATLSNNNPAVAIAGASTSQMPSTSQAQPDDATKMRMIEAISQQSNMNLEWSKKCLEETNWDFNRAGFVFQELFKQNKIPPEAFVK